MAVSSTLIDPEFCEDVKKKVYLPQAADEYHSSSQPLNDVVMQTIHSVSSLPRARAGKSGGLKLGYIADITREGGVSPCALMLALLYIKRLSQSNPGLVRVTSSKDLFLVSVMLASKFMNDQGELEALNNMEWSEIGQKSRNELDKLELSVLDALDWKLYVSMSEYCSFVNGVEGRIALQQATRRGWVTYADLTAIWESSELEHTMLSASKQTAKVAFGGAAVYLMCLATMFAASNSLQMSFEGAVPDGGASSECSVLPESAAGLLLASGPVDMERRADCFLDTASKGGGGGGGGGGGWRHACVLEEEVMHVLVAKPHFTFLTQDRTGTDHWFVLDPGRSKAHSHSHRRQRGTNSGYKTSGMDWRFSGMDWKLNKMHFVFGGYKNLAAPNSWDCYARALSRGGARDDCGELNYACGDMWSKTGTQVQLGGSTSTEGVVAGIEERHPQCSAREQCYHHDGGQFCCPCACDGNRCCYLYAPGNVKSVAMQPHSHLHVRSSCSNISSSGTTCSNNCQEIERKAVSAAGTRSASDSRRQEGIEVVSGGSTGVWMEREEGPPTSSKIKRRLATGAAWEREGPGEEEEEEEGFGCADKSCVLLKPNSTHLFGIAQPMG